MELGPAFGAEASPQTLLCRGLALGAQSPGCLPKYGPSSGCGGHGLDLSSPVLTLSGRPGVPRSPLLGHGPWELVCHPRGQPPPRHHGLWTRPPPQVK